MVCQHSWLICRKVEYICTYRGRVPTRVRRPSCSASRVSPSLVDKINGRWMNVLQQGRNCLDVWMICHSFDPFRTVGYRWTTRTIPSQLLCQDEQTHFLVVDVVTLIDTHNNNPSTNSHHWSFAVWYRVCQCSSRPCELATVVNLGMRIHTCFELILGVVHFPGIGESSRAQLLLRAFAVVNKSRRVRKMLSICRQ